MKTLGSFRKWQTPADFETLFSQLWAHTPALDPHNLSYTPQVDIQEMEEGYLLSFDIPGVEPTDVSIAVRDRTLSVLGERHYLWADKTEDRVATMPAATEKGNWHRCERNFGRFERQFSLPQNINEGSIKANFSNGVLEIFIPREKSTQSRTVKVELGGTGFSSNLLKPKSSNKN